MKPASGKLAGHSLLAAFRYAFRGILHVFGQERNMWLHLIIAVVVIVAGVVLDLARSEWVPVILCMGLVFSSEIMNTAIEGMVDLLSPEQQEKAGQVKDLAAGAVLVCAVTAAIAGLFIFVPHILN